MKTLFQTGSASYFKGIRNRKKLEFECMRACAEDLVHVKKVTQADI